MIYLGINEAEGKPLRPALREFLRFVLSRNGQAAMTVGPEKYLPLTADVARRAQARIR